MVEGGGDFLRLSFLADVAGQAHLLLGRASAQPDAQEMEPDRKLTASRAHFVVEGQWPCVPERHRWHNWDGGDLEV